MGARALRASRFFGCACGPTSRALFDGRAFDGRALDAYRSDRFPGLQVENGDAVRAPGFVMYR